MRKFKSVFIVLGALTIFLIIIAYFIFQMEPFGGTISGARLELLKKSPNFKKGRFENEPPQKIDMELFKTLRLYMQGQVRSPQFQIPVIPVEPTSLSAEPDPGLSAIWFGHATVLIEIGGVRIMTDPVLSEFVSPFAIGPKRIHPSPIALNDLSHIDAVVISHDHFDHLDQATIKHLATQGTHFYIPLGIGTHLERWQVNSNQIHEMDWWDSAVIKNVTIHCTPARHYSGRKRMDNSTLWSSWFVKSPIHSVYLSGDTGYGPHFTEIKTKIGSPSLTLMKIGAYGEPASWNDIHMNPEAAVQAQLDLQSEILLPIHWATFNLAYHAWSEPIERTLKAALGKSFTVITPKVGEKFEFGKPFQNTPWYLASPQ